MKKSFIIVNAVLAVAVIALYVLYFCGIGGQQIASAMKSDETVAGDGSVVYIQIDSLVNGYDMFHDLRTEFEKKAKTAEEDLTKRSKAFEREAVDFQEKVQKGLITRSQAEQLQTQLQQKQQNLQQYAEKLRVDMAEEEAVMLRRIYDAVLTYLKEYNKEHNYSLILSTSGTTNVVMQASSNLNITNDVMSGLNAGYKK